MSLDTGRYQLYSGLKSLRLRWEETREYWQDAVAQEFIKDYWEAVEPRAQATLAAIDRLANVLARVKQECG